MITHRHLAPKLGTSVYFIWVYLAVCFNFYCGGFILFCNVCVCVCVCFVMWKNDVQRGRTKMTTWRMRISCCLPKTTNTHSYYIILTVFPLKQCLHERASMLRYTYIACIVVHKNSIPYLVVNTSFSLYNQKISITYMVRTQPYIFTQNSTLGIQLHVSALCIGHRQVVV